MDNSNLLTFQVIGGAAGLMAGKVMKGGGFDHLVNIFIGIAGGIVGGSIFRLLELSVGVLVSSMLAATVGAIVLATFMGCASTATYEGTGEYIDDSVITSKVKAAIFGEESMKSNEINVETFKGVVQLSGFVNSRDDINKAVEVAGKIKEVASVKNDMRVK